jgi:hypothetical protein
MSQLVDGPILASYYADRGSASSGRDWFSPDLGLIHEFEGEEWTSLVGRAGLRVIVAGAPGAWPHAVLRRQDSLSIKPPTSAAGTSSAN